VETHVLHHIALLRSVRKTHVAKFDFAAGTRDQERAADALGRLVQNLEHALTRGNALLQRAAHIDQTAQRRGNEEQRGQKSKEFIQRQIAGLHLVNRNEQNAAQCDGGDALHHRVADGFGPRQLHVRCTVVFVDLLEALRLMLLGVEYFYQAQGIDGFLRHARDVTHGVLNALAVAAEAAVGDLHQGCDHGRHEKTKCREFPVQIEQIPHQNHDAQGIADQRNGRVGGRRRDQLDVVGQFGQQMTRLLLIRIGDGQTHVVLE
jgi:hypothetical protein